jgi:uncharacterized spore protein YtfJ
MEGILQLVELVSGKVSEYAKSDVVVGEPIVAGNVTLVTLSRVGVGFGGGGGEGEGDFPEGHHGHGPMKPRGGGESGFEGKGMGGGAGAGGRVRPVAVIAFTPEGVQVLPIPDKKGLVDKVFDRMPDLIELAKKAQDNKSGPCG